MVYKTSPIKDKGGGGPRVKDAKDRIKNIGPSPSYDF